MKIKQTRSMQLALFLALPLLTSSPEKLWAVPARQVIEILRQPDGTEISVFQFGDEWNNGLRTLSGHTILRDNQNGFWFYAEPGAGGGLEKSPLVVGRDLPLGIPAQLPSRSSQAPSQPAAFNRSLPSQPAPNLGTQPLLIIFADFTPSVRVSSTASSLNEKFFGAANSVAHYYQTVSYEQFSITPAPETNVGLSGSVNDGIVSVTLNYAHPNPASAIDVRNLNITQDALVAANPFVDFSQFDSNGDGLISATELHLIVVVAGYERSFSPSPCGASVWGHRWGLSPPVVLDNKTVGGTYSQFGEWHCATFNAPGHSATIGIMAHELGHDLGLPDLYDLDGSSAGIGSWSLMAGGVWGQTSLAGDSPAHPDPWSKFFEGWINPRVVPGTLSDQSIAPSATAPDVYQLLPGTPLTGEYFLVENRQKVNYDAALPSQGLLIWHIDTAKKTSTNEDNKFECYPGGPSCVSDHYLVAVVQADNVYDLEIGNNGGDAGDPWPGSSGNTTFNSHSSPGSQLYNGSSSGVSVTGITSSGSVITATLSVLGDIPTVTVLAAVNSATEAGPTSGSFTVTRSESTAAALSVSYSVSGSATSGNDYQPLSGTVLIQAGQSSASIAVTPIDDAVVGELEETVVLQLQANAGYIVGNPSIAVVTITDNDPVLPVVTIVATNNTVTEAGATTGFFTVSRTGSTAAALSVSYNISGSATSGNDYQTLSGSVLIPAGQSSANITVTAIDDAVVGEPDETVVLQLQANAAYTLGNPNSATVTITDNDPILPTVAIVATNNTVTEAGATTGFFTVSRTGSTAAALSVSYNISGSATSGNDYQTLSGSVLIPAGQSSANITVTAIDDAVVGEPDETVVLQLQANAAYTLGNPNSATVTIIDNDPILPTVAIVATNNTATEAGATTGFFTVSRTGSTAAALSVNYNISGSATSGNDYQPLSGTVLIPEGQSSANITVTAIDDAVVAEPDETVVLQLQANAAYTLGNPNSATVTITDNDPAPLMPQTTIESGPPSLSNTASSVFVFSSTVPGSTFACSLNGAPFSACRSPKKYPRLSNSVHAFQVMASDSQGLSDSIPANHIWMIDTTPPDTVITDGPQAMSNQTSSSFQFESEDNSTFQCKLDAGAYEPCASPQTYNDLPSGRHSFQVAAIDSAGNIDKKPALYKWTIDTAPPDTVIRATPPATTNSTTAMFRFSANKRGSTFECRLDGSAFACASPQTYPVQTGSHTFEVQATDPAGNTDPTAASYSWVVQ